MNKKMILIVDDSPTIILQTKRLVASLGYEVHTATNFPEIIKLISTRIPDLILMDVEMPGFDGVQMTGILRKTGKNIPVVYHSSLSADELSTLTHKTKTHGYIIKSNDQFEYKKKLNYYFKMAELKR